MDYHGQYMSIPLATRGHPMGIPWATHGLPNVLKTTLSATQLMLVLDFHSNCVFFLPPCSKSCMKNYSFSSLVGSERTTLLSNVSYRRIQFNCLTCSNSMKHCEPRSISHWGEINCTLTLTPQSLIYSTSNSTRKTSHEYNRETTLQRTRAGMSFTAPPRIAFL